jgi:hypothetical protein
MNRQITSLTLAGLLLSGSLAAESTADCRHRMLEDGSRTFARILPDGSWQQCPKPPRSRPAAQITVKVWPSHVPAGKQLHLGSVTDTTCTAWISADSDPLWTAGLQACRAALAKRGGRQ